MQSHEWILCIVAAACAAWTAQYQQVSYALGMCVFGAALAAWFAPKKRRNLFAGHSSPAAVVASLGLHSASKKHIADGMIRLRRMFAEQESAKMEAVHAGAWELLCSMLGKHEVHESFYVADSVFRTMIHLATLREVLQKIVTDDSSLQVVVEFLTLIVRSERRVATHTLSALDSHAPLACQRACMVLGSIASEEPSLREVATELSAPEALLDVMAWFRKHNKVQQWASWALFQITFDHPIAKRAFIVHGGIDAVVSALISFPENEGVQSQGVAVLVNVLSQDPRLNANLRDVRRAALVAGVLNAVHAAKAKLPSSSNAAKLGSKLVQMLQVCE